MNERKTPPSLDDLDARLHKARFVTATEMEAGQRLAESLVKALTGNDRIAARFLFHEYFEFEPTFTVWLSTNHKPIIRGQDLGIWRRIRLIPFTVTIPEAERDPRLLQRLEAEIPAVLAWAIEGCLAWQRDGLGAPEEVVSATEAYRAQMDVLGVFLCERTYQGPNATCTVKELYDAYKGWCDTNGERAETKNDLNNLLAERGFIPRRTGSRGRFWEGLGIRTEAEG